jgi:hypothetical protein
MSLLVTPTRRSSEGAGVGLTVFLVSGVGADVEATRALRPAACQSPGLFGDVWLRLKSTPIRRYFVVRRHGSKCLDFLALGQAFDDFV